MRFLPGIPAPPDRTDGMKDELRRQLIALGGPHLARWAATQRPAFRQKLRPRCPMDCAINPATARQRAIGGIHDGIDLELGDVGFQQAHDLPQNKNRGAVCTPVLGNPSD